jgi:hypothetical protein
MQTFWQWLTFLAVMAVYLLYAIPTVAARCLLWKAIRLADEVVADLERNRQCYAQESDKERSQ